MVNRKLVRPNLAQVKNRLSEQPNGREPVAGKSKAADRDRPAPAEQTNAESFYYLKQMNTQTPMIVVLNDGERLEGHIEWYDRNCIKVHRPDAPNLLVFKHHIKYLYKQDEESA